MYYLAKLFEATGLCVVIAGFFVAWPDIIHPALFAVGIIIFGVGFAIEKYFFKN